MRGARSEGVCRGRRGTHGAHGAKKECPSRRSFEKKSAEAGPAGLYREKIPEEMGTGTQSTSMFMH